MTVPSRSAPAERRTANRSAWSSDSFRNTTVVGPESGVAPPECRPPHAVAAARTTPLTSVLRYDFHICTSDDCPMTHSNLVRHQSQSRAQRVGEGWTAATQDFAIVRRRPTRPPTDDVYSI